MTRASRLSLFIVGSLLLASCGGVARNPSEPNFPGRGTPQQPGGGTAAQGQSGAPGQPPSADQDPNLQGATSPEDFRDRAHVALIGGNLVTGTNGYTKLVELKPDDPEAAFGLAVTTLWRDAEHFAPFTASQLPLTFFNTPLMLVPTLFPQPLAQEDGYLWRLLALSADSQPGLDPQKVLQDFLAEAGIQAPKGDGLRPQPAQIDPDVLQRLKQGNLSPSGGRSGAPGKDEKTGGEAGDANQSRGGRSRGGDDGARTGNRSAGEPESRSGQQALEEKRGLGDPTKAGDDALADTSPRGRSGSNPTATGGTGAASGSPAAILSQTKYVNFDRDRVGLDLLPKMRTYLTQRAALSFTWEGRGTRLSQLRASVDALLTALERSKGNVKDNFHVELPILMGTVNSPEVHQIAFEKPDFEMLRQQLRLIKWLLDYRSQYTTAGQWNFLVPCTDSDTDGLLVPSEYYPAAPFGTLTESSKESLKGMRAQLGEILRDSGDAMQAYRDARVYEQSNKNYLLPRGLDQSLERVLLDEYNRFLEVSLALPKDEAEVQLSYGQDSGSPLSVRYGGLFDGTLSDVRTLLPAFDTTHRQLAAAEGRPTTLLPGILPEGTAFSVWIDRQMSVDGVIVKSGAPLVKADLKSGEASTQTAELTGLFSLPNLAITPLLGREITVSGAGLAEPVTLLVRVPNVVWDVSIPLQHGAGANAPLTGGIVTSGTDAGVVSTPGGGTGLLSGAAGKIAEETKDAAESGEEEADAAEKEARAKKEAEDAEGGARGDTSTDS